jgi:hypothetical protein
MLRLPLSNLILRGLEQDTNNQIFNAFLEVQLLWLLIVGSCVVGLADQRRSFHNGNFLCH